MMCTSTGGEAPNVIVGAQTLKLCAKALLRTMTFCIESVCPASAWFFLFALHTFYLVYILCMIFLAFVLHVFTFIYHQYHAHVYFLCPHFIIYSPKSYHDWCCIFVYGVTLNKTCLIVPLVWVIYVSTEGVWPSGTTNILKFMQNRNCVPFSSLRPRKDNLTHYIDVIMTTMASQITSLTVVYSIVYSGADKKNAPRHWPLCGESTGDRWIPRTKGQ